MILKRDKRIYMDFASATPLYKKSFKKMKPFLFKNFANPLSLHKEGILTFEALENSRKKIANCLGIKKDEVIFTSGGTESNNLAILGFLKKLPKEKKKKIITSQLEHSSILKTIESLIENDSNIEIIKININEKGLLKLDELEKALDRDVVLISFMYANNEIGVINQIREISTIVKRFKNKIGRSNHEKPFIHSDFGQAPLFLDINFDRLGIQMASIDGSKIYGPKGIGILIKKHFVEMENILYGGGQEFGLRPGTENIANIVGLAESLEISQVDREKNYKKCFDLQKYFFENLAKEIPQAKIIGDINNRLPNNINFCILNLNSEFATIQLDELGISCSPMTTCKNVSEISRSYVVDQIDKECGASSLRFSLGLDNKKSEIDKVIKALKKVIKLQIK